MRKLKIIYFLALTAALISIIFGLSSLSQNVRAINIQPTIAATNYFLIGKNNFEDKSISKGELDQVIGPGKMSTPNDPMDETLTYNEFYMKYNFSPEMANYNSARYQFNPYNYTRYLERPAALQKPANILKQYDLDGNLITDNDDDLEYFTTPTTYRFMAGSNVPQTPKSFLPKSGNIAIKPLFFSYLYVGDGVENENNSYKYNTKILFEDSLKYSENNKLSDYMLTDQNKFVIPTRYNTERDDITLLMRSKTEVNTNRPNVYLDVKDEKNASVVGESANSKYFINANISLHLTPFAYNVLSGDRARTTYQALDGEKGAGQFGIKNGQEMGVNQFNSTMNTALGRVRNSSSEGIVSGIGGSVKLTGFYRDGLEEFGATSTERYEDDENMTDVKFYMLQNEVAPFNRAARTWGADALADEVQGIKNVLSPEVAKFKLSTTRPTITTDVATAFDFDPDEDDFNKLLGMNSIKIEDTGITNFADAAGKPQSIAVDNDNLRVRVKEVGSNDAWSAPKTVAQLKSSITDYAGKKIDIAYVYSATDANQENIGLLPEEIENNTGAYAIPLVKQVDIAEPKQITVKYVLEGDEAGTPLYTDTTTGKLGEAFDYTADAVFKKDDVEYKLITTPATVNKTYENEPQLLVFVYKKINYSTIKVDYVVQGDEAGTPIFTSTVNNVEGTKFDHEAPATYMYNGDKYKLVTEPNNVDTRFTDSDQTFRFVYKKIILTTITVEYYFEGKEDEGPFSVINNTDEVGEPFYYEVPLEYRINGDDYELLTLPNILDTFFTDKDQTFIYMYKKKKPSEIEDKGKVITRYVNEDGVVLYTSDEVEGKIGDPYNTIAPAVYEKDGVMYERITVPTNNEGVYKKETQTVDYIYRAYGQVTATYKAKDGTVLKEDEQLSGPVDSNYVTTTHETITVGGKTYKLVETPSNQTGTYAKSPVTVAYVYELQTEPQVEKGQVIIRYVDEKGQVLETKDPKKGVVKTNYTTDAPENITINQVVYVRVAAKDPKNATGVYTKDDIYVDYVYKKKSTVQPVVLKGKVIVRYVDEKGKVLKTLEPKTGEVKKDYKTSAPNKLVVKDVDYVRVAAKDPKNATGVYTENTIYVNYIFKENLTEDDETITEDTENQDGNDNPISNPTTIPSTITSSDGNSTPNEAITNQLIPSSRVTTLKGGIIPSNTATTNKEIQGTTTSDGNKQTVTNSTTAMENATVTALPQTGVDETVDKLFITIGLLLMLGASFLFRRSNKKQS